METVFIVSSVLLVSLLGLRYAEFVYTDQRLLELRRMQLDRGTRRFFVSCKRNARQATEYLHKDVLLNVLHMVTYVALVLVRFVENRLHKGTLFLRSFKNNRTYKNKKNPLQSIKREGPVDEKGRQYE